LQPNLHGEKRTNNRLRHGIAIFIVFSVSHSKQISLYCFKLGHNSLLPQKGKGKVHPKTGHEGPEEE
jgi:hypothetical protein